MKKTTGIIAILLAVMLTACENQSAKEAADEIIDSDQADFGEIIADIKDILEKDIKQEDEHRDVFQNYSESDLTYAENKETDASIWIKKLSLNPKLIENGTVLEAMKDANADELILLEAKNKDDVDELKASLEKGLEAQVRVWKQKLPEQYEKVKANEIVTQGKFLMYVTYSNPEIIINEFSEHF